MPQGSVQWQGTQRRACGPGANWNVQVVRGKVTTRCIWHACRALGIGLLLMLLGACMATIGYYADQLSVAQEIRGNITVQVTNESRVFHLNNLSYAGPIVMGVGGFIVVAACVMTFEARDSAAKVVPARFRFNQGSTMKNRNQRSRRSTSSQTTKWDHQFGLFRVNRTPSPSAQEIYRKQLTAEFRRFSKNLQDKGAPANPIKKSPSAPSLAGKKSPAGRKTPKYAGCALLNPNLLQRQALSVDNPGYSPQHRTTASDSLERGKITGSQASMAMDLHIPNKGPVTLRVKDRSDTARRHQLLRQTRVDDIEEATSGAAEETRRNVGHSKKQLQPDISNYALSEYSRFPDDFLPRKRSSIDIRNSDDFGIPTIASCSPRDFRKISSPNFRHMSFDRIGGERRMGNRKASLEFKRSPDSRRAGYRCILDDGDVRSRANTGESLSRQRRPKLYHSRSDDNRRRSFDKHKRDSQQSSRYSLNNTQVVVEGCGPEYELKYFATVSVASDELESRANSEESHVVEIDETTAFNATTSDGPVESDALLEEPELENVSDGEIESSSSDDEPGDDIVDVTKIRSQGSRISGKKRLVAQETVLHVDAQ